ncbi:MAG: methyltransferase family protein [Deltaproteobacteria bacterium]
MGPHATSPEARPGVIPWPPLLLIAAVAGAVALGQSHPLAWPGVGDRAASFVGLGLGAAGLALLIWAGLTLRRHRTTILPHEGATHLVTDGPYRWRRHPIYIADVLLLFGAAELTRNIWFVILAFAFAGLVAVLQIIPEERHLEARFGQAWRDYAARTRRWI